MEAYSSNKHLCNEVYPLHSQYPSEKGLKKKDALHIACAIEMKCDYFITTDYGLLKKRHEIKEIKVLNSVDFPSILEE